MPSSMIPRCRVPPGEAGSLIVVVEAEHVRNANEPVVSRQPARLGFVLPLHGDELLPTSRPVENWWEEGAEPVRWANSKAPSSVLGRTCLLGSPVHIPEGATQKLEGAGFEVGSLHALTPRGTLAFNLSERHLPSTTPHPHPSLTNAQQRAPHAQSSQAPLSRRLEFYRHSCFAPPVQTIQISGQPLRMGLGLDISLDQAFSCYIIRPSNSERSSQPFSWSFSWPRTPLGRYHLGAAEKTVPLPPRPLVRRRHLSRPLAAFTTAGYILARLGPPTPII